MIVRTHASRTPGFGRVARIFPSLFVLLALAGAAYAKTATIAVLFPAKGAYTYWLQSKSGVAESPKTVQGGTRVDVPNMAGSSLYVQDGKTGHMVAFTLNGEPSLAITVPANAFGPVETSPAPPGTQGAGIDGAISTEGAGAAPSGEPVQRDNRDKFSSTVSLVIAGIVVVLIVYLVASRGKPFAALAQKAGMDAPNPTGWDVREEDYVRANAQAVERVPDEAGVAPDSQVGAATAARPKRIKGQPHLVGISGLAVNTAFPITAKVMTIGRGAENGIVLKDNTISRCHARLERSKDGKISLTDEDSSNGIYVNGMRVEQAVLKSGDEIKIGASYFRFEV
jgi:hypothetical protein